MKPRILVPFDFSPPAERALAWATDLQKTTGGDLIQIVHAVNSRPATTMETSLDSLLPSQAEIGQMERKMLDASRKLGATATSAVIIRPAPIGDIILDEARSGKADMIVMGTHGRTGIRRLFLGSVAEHVLRHTDCPVVTIHAHRGEDRG